MQVLDTIANWLLSKIEAIVFLILGFLLGLLTSWLTARYTRRAQKADERRERVYAPLIDELEANRKALENYDQNFSKKEYDQIAYAHLFYLIPTTLKMQIHELYTTQASLSLMLMKLREKYREQIEKDIDESLPMEAPSTPKDSNVTRLAGIIASSLPLGKIPDIHRSDFDTVVKNLRENSGWKEPIDAYIKKLIDALSKDEEMTKIEALRKKILELLKNIQDNMMSDLKKQF